MEYEPGLAFRCYDPGQMPLQMVEEVAGGRKEAKGTFTASCAVFTVIMVEDPECQQEDFLKGKLGSVG
jgi:hypothetical protein